MIVLALDSTTPRGSVGLSLPDGTLDVCAGDASRGWSERLPGEAMAVLAAHGLRLSDVGLFAVAAGPGSLTGLRVGMATMQGFSLATGRPLVPVSALDALAWHGYLRAGAGLAVPGQALRLGAWADARRGEVFSALYECQPSGAAGGDPWNVIEDASVGPPEETAARWRSSGRAGPVVVAGDVEGPLGDILRRALGPDIDLLDRPLLGGHVATLARQRALRGLLGLPHAVRPLYVRTPDAVLARARAMATSPAPTKGHA